MHTNLVTRLITFFSGKNSNLSAMVVSMQDSQHQPLMHNQFRFLCHNLSQNQNVVIAKYSTNLMSYKEAVLIKHIHSYW